MKNIFKVAENILDSGSSNLIELAELAGHDPKVMYLGANLAGADLRGQDIRFLAGLGADYSEAILDSDQRKFLTENDIHGEAKLKHGKWMEIAQLRISIIDDFLKRHVAQSQYDHLKGSLLQSLRVVKSQREMAKVESEYSAAAIKLLATQNHKNLHSNWKPELVRMLVKARFPFNIKTLEAIEAHIDHTLFTKPFRYSLEIALCSNDFLIGWLRRLGVYDKKAQQETIRLICDGRVSISSELLARLLPLTERPAVQSAVLKCAPEIDNETFAAAVSEFLLQRANAASDIRRVARDLEHVPHFRKFFLSSACQSPSLDLSVVAFKLRTEEHDVIDPIEISDIVFNLSDHELRLALASRTKGFLGRVAHKNMVVEIEKHARTRQQAQRARRLYPEYFPHTRMLKRQTKT